MSQSLRLASVKRPLRSTCAMPEAASSKVCRKRASLSASAVSACLRERNWPICAPTRRMVLIRRSSGWRTMPLEMDSTPTMRPSKVTGQIKAPCTPASRTRALTTERASRLTSELHTSAPPLGEFAADAAIAEEFARIRTLSAEHRLAAHRQEAHFAVRVDAAHLEIAERLARLQRGAVRGPAGGVGMDRRPVPARFAEHG